MSFYIFQEVIKTKAPSTFADRALQIIYVLLFGIPDPLVKINYQGSSHTN
jgi:hypothetical protein